LFRILSLSGGGFKGLFSAGVLANIEKRIDRPIAGSFEMIAGTSVGAIVALAAAAGIPMATLVERLRQDGPLIFPNRKRSNGVLSRLRGFASPLYDAAKLQSLLSTLFEDRTIGDLKVPIVIPATNLTTGRPKVFKTPHHNNFFRDRQFRLVDVALASAAAPIYFQIATVGNELYADGGLFATSPDLIATHEAEVWLEQERESIHVLSVGTLSTKFSIPHSAGTQFGIFQWMKNSRLLEAMFSSQQLLVMYMMEQRFKGRYFRIDTAPGYEISSEMGLDAANGDIQTTMLGLADDEAGKAMNVAAVREMLAQPSVRIPMNHG
jgi:uncharacterized protein